MSGGAAWVQALERAKKTAMVVDDVKKVQYLFDDGREMVEEWAVKSDVLQARKWRKTNALGRKGEWEFEVGEPALAAPAVLVEGAGLAASATNPVFFRKDTRKEFQWRVRNIPYPLDVYSLTVNDDGEAVLRTSNKKYFKKFSIPDLARCGIPVDKEGFTLAHANSTLIITYAKPPEFVAVEAKLKQQRDALKAASDGDVDCAQQ